MEKKSNNLVMWVIAGVVLVIAIAGVVYLLTTGKQEDTTANDSVPARENTEEKTTTSTQPETETNADGTVIVFTDNGFQPTEYTSKLGEPVTVKNESSNDLQFSSDNHPAHTDEPELNMSVLAPGKSGTFTPTNAGTHGFHDHLNDQFTGTIVVK